MEIRIDSSNLRQHERKNDNPNKKRVPSDDSFRQLLEDLMLEQTEQM